MSTISDFETAAGDGNGTLNTQTFTSSGTWTKPTGVTNIEVLIVGGGGGGGGCPNFSNQDCYGGGGGGGTVKKEFLTVTGDVSVSIGSGGAASKYGSGGSATTLSGGCSFSALGGRPGHYSAGGDTAATSAHRGGGGFQDSLNSTANVRAGCGGGAGGNAQQCHGMGFSSVLSTGYYTPDSFLSTNGHHASKSSESAGTLVNGAGGVGLFGYGGGGAGAMCHAPSIYRHGQLVSDGGAAGVEMDKSIQESKAGIAASPNTGGGGGGAGSRGGTGTEPLGGAGGSGICIIKWWTA